jgi:hypothetical protein
MPTAHSIQRVAVTTWWLLLVLLWSRFWWLDLRHAQAADLLLFPVLVGTVTGVLAASGGYGWPRALGLGVALGLLPVWVYFWSRAANVGCIGVSDAYSDAIAGSFVLFLHFVASSVWRSASSANSSRPRTNVSGLRES